MPGTVRDGDAPNRTEETGGAAVFGGRPCGGEHQLDRLETGPWLVEMLRGDADAGNHGGARIESFAAHRRHRQSRPVAHLPQRRVSALPAATPCGVRAGERPIPYMQ